MRTQALCKVVVRILVTKIMTRVGTGCRAHKASMMYLVWGW
jgi:hypothetical protein